MSTATLYTNGSFGTIYYNVTSIQWVNTGGTWLHNGSYTVWEYQNINDVWVSVRTQSGSGTLSDFTYVFSTPTHVKGFRYRAVEGHYHGSGQYEIITYQPIDIANVVISNNIHKENVRLSFKVSTIANEPLSYRILVGGVEKVVWTPYVVGPLTVSLDLDYSWFVIGTTPVVIEARTQNGASNSYATSVTRVNSPPVINLTVSSAIIHKEGAVVVAEVTDPHQDSIQYKLSLNGKQIIPASGGWSVSELTPFLLNYVLRNSDLALGVNVVRFDVQDEFGASSYKELTITKINSSPQIIDPQVKGRTLYVKLDDPDKDLVRFRVYVNDTKILPPDAEWTKAIPTPKDLIYTFPENTVKINNINKVRIEVLDDLGTQTNWEAYVQIDYAGLLFTDEIGQYYSTDIGVILKYLEMGTVIAGNTSGVYKVYLKNTLGYPVKNIHLLAVQRDLDLVNETVELSKTDTPFIAGNSLEFPDYLEHGQKIPFYVRINTTRRAVGGGKFDIWVYGDPI